MFYYKTLKSSLETDKCDKYLISFNIATNFLSRVFFFTTYLGFENCNDVAVNGGTESSQI